MHDPPARLHYYYSRHIQQPTDTPVKTAPLTKAGEPRCYRYRASSAAVYTRRITLAQAIVDPQ